VLGRVNVGACRGSGGVRSTARQTQK
jgi:hypothetical protein